MSDDWSFRKSAVYKSSSSEATTNTFAYVSSLGLCSMRHAPECLSFTVTAVILGEKMLVHFNRPWELVEICERRNSEDIAPRNLSVTPQRFDGSRFTEGMCSWPLLDGNILKVQCTKMFS